MDEGEAVVSHVISAALGGRGRAWGEGGGRHLWGRRRKKVSTYTCMIYSTKF